MKNFLLFFLSILPACTIFSQDNDSTARRAYLAELKVAGRKFTGELYPNYDKIYLLPEKNFISKIDSARNSFLAVLSKYRSGLSGNFSKEQETEIKYYFDKLLIEYPINHDMYMGHSSDPASFAIPVRLAVNLPDFNKPELLKNEDFTSYVKAFLSLQVSRAFTKPAYRNSSNKHLDAVWNLIPSYFSNTACKEFWQFTYLYDHIDNNGIKHIQSLYNRFLTGCKDTSYTNKIRSLYSEDAAGRKGHLVNTYKTAGPYDLDIHLFLPDTPFKGTPRPVILFFHGGSWSTGKPDWFFYGCESYAKKGWIAAAVEYRTYGRHGTLPFEAVMDARSAVRWLRKHAKEYNIDTGRIVVSGNSAGGHLALCTAIADQWNEKTDNLRISASPNLIMVNAAVYDLTDRSTAWIRKDLTDKKLAEQISPNHLGRKAMPPTLIIHGTNDNNVPFAGAELFAEKMKLAGNPVEFYPLNGAGHFIWYEPKYSPEVTRLRNEFLSKWKY